MRLILGCLIVLSSCVMNPQSTSMSIPEFDYKLTQEWIYATGISNLKYNDEVITRPPGFEQLVMSLTIPNEGGLADKIHCLYYQVPYKEKVGRIRVQETKNQSECPDVPNENIFFVSLDKIDNFKISTSGHKIRMNFDYQKIKTEILIPTPNIESGLIHEKYRALTEKRLISGLRLLRLNEDSFDFASNKYLGQLSDRFSRGTAIR